MADIRELTDERYIDLVTFRKDGSEASTPVWHVVLDDKIYVFTEADAYKVRRLRRDPRARVAACGMTGGDKGAPTFEGTGRIVDDSVLTNRVYAALSEKYGWQMWLANVLSAAVGRIGGRAVLELSF